eukprot:tig00000981_g5872.t1
MPTPLDGNLLALTAIITVGQQVLFFAIAWTFKFDTRPPHSLYAPWPASRGSAPNPRAPSPRRLQVTDFAGGTNFLVLALVTFFVGGSYLPRQIVVTCLVCLWSIRLAGFLLMRILMWGHDNRFDETRNNFGKFATFWIFQALWVWTVSLPVTLLNASLDNPEIAGRDIAGWVMFGVGLAIEAVADVQKLRFKQDPANKGKWCSVGVWYWTRHPNYFGEMLLWWGIFTSCSSVFIGDQAFKYFSVIGPAFVMVILLLLSGMPLLEKSSDEKFGHMDAYKEYKNSTSPIIPLPRTVYRALPRFVKALFLFEWPMYQHPPKAAAGGAGPQAEQYSTFVHTTGKQAHQPAGEVRVS